MVWSFAEKTTFLPSDGGIAFTAADKATILGAMQTAYDGSSTAKTMFDNWIDAGKTIEIKFVPGAFAAYPNTGKLELDLSFLTNNTYITPTGKAVEDTAVTAIVHELGHALTGRRDNGDYVTDYKGENVKFVNQIYQELGLPEQISYIAYDDDGSLHELNFDYTEGATIDRAVSRDSDWNSSAAGNSKDLLIGGPSANTLQSGDGNDFLWGAGGNDSLFGGNGTDTVGFKGKPTDYDLRQNPDGTWTSRHVRGAANEGTDTITNIEKVMFKGGETFDLKKKGLTYQLDFALVIDTTGSMGDDIGAVKAQGNAIINALFADDTKDARIGIVGFKDTTIGQPTSIILPFTDQNQFADRKTAALNALNGISVSGGGDLPETAFDGLLKALNGTMGNWRPGAGVHRVVLFTDAPAKDRSLKGAVDALAANIGATITSSSRAVGASGTLDSFTFSAIAPNSSEKELFSPGSRDEDPVLPPFEFIDESPTPDTSIANLEIYTIYTGNFGSLDPDLESIASTTGGSSFVAPDPDDLVNTLLTIINLPSITLAVSPESVTEDGTNNLVYTFTRTGATTTALTVNYTIGGTATLNTDYTRTGTNNTVTFAANATTATVTVDPTVDTTVEPNETVALTLASGTGYTIGTTTPVTGTINNDDTNVTLPSITLAVSPSSITEDGTANLVYTFTRTGVTTNALTVNYSIGGTATLNTDYTRTGTNNTVTFAANATTATVTVDPTVDTTVEPNETVALTLASGTGYTIGTTTAVTGTINNDDTTVTLAVSPGSVTEDGTSNLVYTFTRTGVTTNALTVNYTIGGTATNGSDYASLPSSIAFAAGLATATVIVDPTADTTVESNETVALTLASGTGYTIGTTTAVTGTINNDDFFQLSINNVTVVEGQDSNATLTVTVNNPNPQQISVNYATAPVNATANVDYTSKTGTLIIPANISTANITIPILNDHLNESDKAFTVTLSNPTNATINPNEASGQVIITDTLQSSINKTLATNVENLTLTGTTAINGTGNAGNNILTGNSTNNTLNGEDGNDTLNGGAGIDTLIGGAGNDIYVVDSTTDVITEVASQGIDTVQSSVTFTLANVANVENLTLTGTTAINGTGNTGNNILTGNGGNNTLNGGDGNDTLNGGAGIDTLNGGAGNDIYVVDSITDTITESANAGTDTIQSSVTYTIATLTNIENLTLATLAGAAAINGTGNTGNNVITGNSANNILNGGAGIDTLIGGAGNDIYVVDTTTDTITENANAGTDTIQSSVTYTIAALANVENLTLTGTAAINGTGNAGNNVITGNGANNTLNGGAGNDTLNGGAGDDTYIFTINGIGLGRDTITDGSGVDTISFAGTDATTSIRLNLGTSFGQTVDANTNTKVVLTADAIENAIGGDGNDRLIGNSLDNTLEGGLGNDILNGSTGNDFLFGGDGDDSLSGGDDDDYLTGGLGSNNLFGGAGIDQFVFSGDNPFNTTDNGVDIIADFSTGVDQLVLSKTVFDFLSSDVGIGFSDPSDFDYVEDDEFAGDSNARIVYSLTSGSLFYNQDGATAGFGTGGEFAVVDLVTANDFVIIA
ncbi:MAG: beta strand repeat-containing protein [Dolichospermum sp.]